MSDGAIPQDAKIWEQAVRKLRGGMMPPPGHKHPEAAAVNNLVSYLETTLDAGNSHPDHGSRAAASPESPRIRQRCA